MARRSPSSDTAVLMVAGRLPGAGARLHLRDVGLAVAGALAGIAGAWAGPWWWVGLAVVVVIWAAGLLAERTGAWAAMVLGLMPIMVLPRLLDLEAVPAPGEIAVVWAVLAVLMALGLVRQRWRQSARQTEAEALREIRAELRERDAERTVLHRHIRRYPVLLSTCLELSSAREADQVAELLTGRARDLVERFKRAAVFIGPSDAPVFRSGIDEHGQARAKVVSAEESFVAGEQRILLRREGGLIRLWVPLRGDRRSRGPAEGAAAAGADTARPLRGVLYVEYAKSGPVDRLTQELVVALARLGGLGLATVALMDEARSLALHDDLTGLYGQFEFLRRLDEQVASSRRAGEPLCVVMCDMDHLKKYNDTHGHPAGDEALRAVAAALTGAAPADTIACRYGGEEFAVLLPGLDLAAGLDAARAIHAAIGAARVSHADARRRVTASVGVAALGDGETGRQVLARADAACYQAKRGGRNRVEVAR